MCVKLQSDRCLVSTAVLGWREGKGRLAMCAGKNRNKFVTTRINGRSAAQEDLLFIRMHPEVGCTCSDVHLNLAKCISKGRGCKAGRWTTLPFIKEDVLNTPAASKTHSQRAISIFVTLRSSPKIHLGPQGQKAYER